MASERRVAGTIRSLLNARDLQLQCARLLHETLLVPVLMYGSEKERSTMWAVQMNLKGLLGIRRMDRVPNAWIRELCSVRKGLDEGDIRWFEHVERMERVRIAKRVSVGECADSRSVGRPWKKWIDTMKECLKERGLDVRQVNGGGL